MLPRLHRLALTSSVFAVLGGIAGWSWWHLLANPLMSFASPGHQVPATLGAALCAGAAGRLLAPAPPSEDGRLPGPSLVRIAAALAVAGALAGACAALLHAPASPARAAGFGALAALTCVPAAAVVVAALRRLGQARRASIVARAEGRALVSTIAVIAAVSSLLSLLDWPAATAGVTASAPLAASLLVAAAVLVLVLLVGDLVALGRVERLAAALDGAAEDADDLVARPEGRVDLGLGDAIATRSALGTAYRGGGPAVTEVRGDLYEATAALRRCVRRGVAMIAVLELLGFCHGMARSIEWAADAGATLCDGGRVGACREAALLAERAGRPREEAERLHRTACEQGDEGSCLAADLMAWHAAMEE